MYKFKIFSKQLVGFLYYFLIIALPAQVARGAETESNNSEIVIESITVTATRKDSKLLKTPIAISAFDINNQLAGQIEGVPDIAYQVPGLTIGNTGNSAFPEIFLRGVGSRDPSVASDPSIGFYIDDVYVGRGFGMFTDLLDLQRVEVIKGPQGSLWGRNTLGGAIHLITNRPSENSANSVYIDIGNYSDISLGGLYSGRTSNNSIGKIAFNKRKRDGYSFNIFDDTEIGDADNFSLRASLLYELSDRSEWLLSSDYTRDRSTSAAFDPLITNTPLLGGILGNISVTDFPFSHIEPAGEFVVNNRPNAREHRDIYGFSGKYTLDTDNYVFKSITAFRKAELDNIEHNDGLSIQLVEINQLSDQYQFSQEFRISGEKQNYQWMTGIYYFREQTDDSLRINSQGFNIPFSGIVGQQDYSTVNSSDIRASNYAIYGNLKYYLSNRLTLDLGVRYSKEYKEFIFSYTNNDINNILLLNPSVADSLQRDDWGSFSPNLTLSYQLENTLYYASVSRGFKSGGYNSLQTTVSDAFDPEYLIAYQSGIKSKLFEGKLELDTSLYYYDHEDLQVPTLIPDGGGGLSLVTTNAAEATEKGVEFFVKVKPTDGVQLDASITILDAEYDRFLNATLTDVSGNSISMAPKYSGVLGFDYSTEPNNGVSTKFRVEYIAQSRIYFTETNIDELMQPDYSLINSYIEISSNRSPLKATLYGKNLTDEVVASTAVDFINILGTVSRVYNPPRTYGLKIELTF